ncbi:hypothetical protein BJX63DRAFT_416125 [Aspergillus granulosus]|uniref:Uncharacterized protein n=1 Tax=Aspergillus granulosus TaxID=176169 RepID=A0ABR4GSB8_9EURO
MLPASPLRDAALVAATKVRSQIERPLHDRYFWLFISPISKDDVKPVVDSWLSNKDILHDVSNTAGISFGVDPWQKVSDYYPIVWSPKSGTARSPFPGKVLVIIGLEYVNENNGLPNLTTAAALHPGDYILIQGDEELKLGNGSGGISLFVLLEKS